MSETIYDDALFFWCYMCHESHSKGQGVARHGSAEPVPDQEVQRHIAKAEALEAEVVQLRADLSKAHGLLWKWAYGA